MAMIVMNLVPPEAAVKLELLFNQLASNCQVIEHRDQTFVAKRSVTKFMAMIVMNLVTPG